MSTDTIRGFPVRLDRAYEIDNHMWVEICSAERVRIGMDSLGIETAGTLAQLEFLAVGTVLSRGDAMGSLEAEKFVGPLVAPLSGTIIATNGAAIENPSIVERDPYGDGWMIELTPVALADELTLLARGSDSIRAAFERRVEEYRRDGVLAE